MPWASRFSSLALGLDNPGTRPAADPGTARSLPPRSAASVLLMVRNDLPQGAPKTSAWRPRPSRRTPGQVQARRRSVRRQGVGRFPAPFSLSAGAPFFLRFRFRSSKGRKSAFNSPVSLCEAAKPLAQFSPSCTYRRRTLLYQLRQPGRNARALRKHSRCWNWSRLPSLSNWPSGRSGIAATRVRRTPVTPDFLRPCATAGPACRCWYAAPRRCRRSAAASIATLPTRPTREPHESPPANKKPRISWPPTPISNSSNCSFSTPTVRRAASCTATNCWPSTAAAGCCRAPSWG